MLPTYWQTAFYNPQSLNTVYCFGSVGNIPADQLQAFASELRHALNSRELLVSSDLPQTSKCSTQILISAPGAATRSQLKQLNQSLALQGNSIAGWVFLDPRLRLS